MTMGLPDLDPDEVIVSQFEDSLISMLCMIRVMREMRVPASEIAQQIGSASKAMVLRAALMTEGTER